MEGTRTITHDKLAAVHNLHRKSELDALFRTGRVNAVVARTRQTIDQLMRQPPHESTQMDGWYERLNDNFKVMANSQPPYTLQQASMLFELVRRQPSLSGFDLLVWTVKFADDRSLQQMIDGQLVEFLTEAVQNKEELYADCAVEALAELAAKNASYRNFLLFNHCFETVEERVRRGQLSVDMQCRLFEQIMKHPFQQRGHEAAAAMLKQHIHLFKDTRCSLQHIFMGLCNSLLWKEKWVCEVLEDCDIYACVEEVSDSRSLNDSQIYWMVYLLALLGSNSPREWKPIEKTLVKLCKILMVVLEFTRQGDIKKAHHYSLFILEQLFADASLCQELGKALRQGLLKVLVNFIVQGYNRPECENAMSVIYNIVNCLEVDSISQQIIGSGLVECIIGRLAAYQLYSASHLSIMLEILDTLADQHCLVDHLHQTHLRKALETLRTKLSDYDMRETIIELLNRLPNCS